MWRSATLATLVSSTSMKVASITVKAMIHGLIDRGRCAACATGMLLGVERLHLADAVGEVGARLVVAVERRDLVVAGAGQGVLGLDHFDIVGDAGLKAIARLLHFLPRQLDAEVGDIDLAARAGQLGDRQFSLPARCGCAISCSCCFSWRMASSALRALGLNAAAGEERDIDDRLVAIDRDGGAVVESLFAPEAADGERAAGAASAAARSSSSARCSWERSWRSSGRACQARSSVWSASTSGVSKKLTWSASSTRVCGSTLRRRQRPKSEVSQLRARHDQALLFVLQLRRWSAGYRCRCRRHSSAGRPPGS